MTERAGWWLRRMVVGLALLVLIALAVHKLLSTRIGQRVDALVSRLEQLYGPMTPASLVPPEIPDASNRAPLLRAAIEGVTLVQERPARRESNLLGRAAALERDVLEGRIDELRAILARNDLTLDLVQRAATRPGANWGIAYYRGGGASAPPLRELVDLSQLVGAAAAVRLEDGDVAGAAERLADGLAVAESLAGESLAIAQLVRAAIGRRMLGILRELLARTEPDEATLEGLAQAVEAAWHPEGTRRGYVGEMKILHHMFESLDLGSTPSGGDSLIETNAFLRWLARPYIRSEHEYFLRLQERTIDWVSRPYDERRQAGVASPFDEVPPRWRAISRIYLPNLDAVVRRGDLDAARFALARTALALRRQRVRSGRYPEELAELVPAWFEELPTDPFRGAPPVYVRDGAGFTLRSGCADLPPEATPGKNDPLCEWSVPR